MFPSEEDERIREWVAALLSGDEEPGDLHPCPFCGGQFRLRFTPYRRGERKMIGILAGCADCGRVMAMDYDGTKLPGWLAES